MTPLNPRTKSRARRGFAHAIVIAHAVFSHGLGSAAGLIAPASPGYMSVEPQVPSGFSNQTTGTPPPRASARAEGSLEGLHLTTTLSGVFMSSVQPGSNATNRGDESDFILSPGLQVDYRSLGSRWSLMANYRCSYDQYFNQSDYSGFNHGFGLVLAYRGHRLDASLAVGVDRERGSNMYYSSSFVQQTSAYTRFTARYRLSPKTCLQAELGQTSTSASSGNYNDTDAFDFGVSALWRCTPLTEIGPGIRYTKDSGSSLSERTSFGPTLTLNYKLGAKTTLTSRVGMDFTDYETGSSDDSTFSASVGLNYQPTRLSSLYLSFYRDTQASPSLTGGFNEITAVRLGYQRLVRRSTWNFGVAYQMNAQQTLGGTTGPGSDSKSISLDASWTRPLFSNRLLASLFMRYEDRSGNARNDWNSFQAGFNLSRSF